MINEGVYAESPAMQEMKAGITTEVKDLMDGGYTMDEASKECMNKFRKDSRYAHDDEFVLPIVLKAAKDYMEACSSMSEEVAEAFPETDINEYLFQEMAKEVGMEIDNVEALKAIEDLPKEIAKSFKKAGVKGKPVVTQSAERKRQNRLIETTVSSNSRTKIDRGSARFSQVVFAIQSNQKGEKGQTSLAEMLKLKKLINKRLPAEVRRNMGRPALINQTGRFSNRYN